ncbi:MAG: hypothetical protein JWM95_1740 [Gemmatimonadetes bacterium]|nr:hypothetical protein [Gemmatimonadota bacterium]
MSELYTSLVRLKQAMNNGALPPMTDIPLTVQDVIDPTLTIGLGALFEDTEKGLRCPVRGCGVYRHMLSSHITTVHADVGGANGVRDMMEIPRSTPLASQSYRQAKIAEFAARRGDGLAILARARATNAGAAHKRDVRVRAEQTKKIVYKSAGLRNLTNRCEAQMRHALIDLQNQIGRSPTVSEARSLIGEGFAGQVIAVYGTWNAAKARFGLDQYKRGHSRKEITRDMVLEALSAYYDVHECLPNQRQARKATRTPLIPSFPTILKAMGCKYDWTEAMQRAASLLNIYGGRYGLPESARPDASKPVDA